jgi:tripartite-type tricarboxylate transporter receptor subunit TctC
VFRNGRTRDLGKTAADRELLTFISTPTQIGRALLAPPNVPKERLAALRKAFFAAMKDPKLLAGAKKSNLPVRPASGKVVQAAVLKALASSPDLVARAKKALGVK